MSAIFPSCLPWQTKHDFDIEGRTTIIGNVDGEIIDGTTHNTFDFVCRTLDLEDDSQSHSIAVANADFIVRACNSHKALVEALRAAKAQVEVELDDLLHSVCLVRESGPDRSSISKDDAPFVALLDSVIRVAGNALSSAEAGA